MSESSQEPNPLVASESDSMLYELQPQARLYGQPSPRSHPSSARMQIKLNIDPSGLETDNEDAQSNTQQEDKSISKFYTKEELKKLKREGLAEIIIRNACDRKIGFILPTLIQEMIVPEYFIAVKRGHSTVRYNR